MNIKRAKEEIKDTIEAYLLKDERGNYVIPAVRQRPVLLMGPPGVGKTQIMEQIARECGIGLVAYTITHHTRQSAVGLPFIVGREYGGQKKSVTEYTMSEIVASVYDKIESAGLKEGILFIDEINCVSETLAPTMLQFLQGKTFGSHRIPEGWIITAAGNPPEFNKSVRDFDLVTLDRVKMIHVEADFEVWKEYAYEAAIHPAVTAYLNIRKENLCRIETTVDGKLFATPRGWEDLSRLLEVYERLGKSADREVIGQYLQFPVIAKDFANYLELYYKYKDDYRIDEILEGAWKPTLCDRVGRAPFDEKLSIISLLLARLCGRFREVLEEEARLELLQEQLRAVKQAPDKLDGQIHLFEEKWNWKREAGLLSRREDYRYQDVADTMKRFARRLEENLAAQEPEDRAFRTAGDPARGELSGDPAREELSEVPARDVLSGAPAREVLSGALERDVLSGISAWDQLSAWFGEMDDELQRHFDQEGERLEHAFDFMEASFSTGQEMVIFITELHANRYSVRFLQEYDCERYYQYNEDLLFRKREDQIQEKMNKL